MTHEAAPKPNAAPSVTIEVVRGRSATSSREMKGQSLLLGSGSQCDIQMRSPDVALKHALITRSVEGVVLRALDPARPVHVNDQPLAETQLHDGDRLRLGPFQLAIRITGAPRPAVASPLSILADLPSANVQRPNLDSAMRELSRLTRASSATGVVEEVPTQIRDVQRAHLEMERDVERRRRAIHDELARVERERTQLQQERARFETQRQDVDRQRRWIQEREADKARTFDELDLRARRLRDEELRIEQQRVIVADEALRLDRAQEDFSARKNKFLRVRRRLIEQYRARRTEIAALAREIDQRSQRLALERATHDHEVAHHRRLTEELGRRQADMKRLEAETLQREDQVQRREVELRERVQRFEADLVGIHAKDKSLESLKQDLDRRREQLALEEAALHVARQSVDEQIEKLKARSSEVHRRSEDVEARRYTLDRQEQHLREQAAILEEQRRDLAEMDRQLAVRETAFAQAESDLQSTAQELQTLRVDLETRESSVQEQLEVVAQRETRLQEWEERSRIEQEELQRRFADLELQTRDMLDRLEAERREMDARRREIEELHQASLALHASMDARLNDRVAELTTTTSPAPEGVDVDLVPFDVSTSESHSAESARQLAESLERRLHQARERALELRRQAESLAEDEADWLSELAEAQADFETSLVSIEKTRERSHRRAAVHHKRAQQLRDMTAKIFGKPSSAHQRAQSLQRTQQHHEEVAESEHQAQTALTDRLRSELARMFDHREQSARISAEWTNRLELLTIYESDAAAKIQDAVQRTLEGTIADDGDAREDNALAIWHQFMEESFDALERRRRDLLVERRGLQRLDRDRRQFSSSESSGQSGNSRSIITSPATMSLADLIEPCLHLSDDDLAARLEQSTLLEEHRLQSARQFAVHRRTRLAAELLQTGCLTPYQLSKLVGGQTDSLRLGSAVVLDELHTGSVATTYKIRMPGVGQPVAARMLRPALSRDPAQRRQSEIVVDAMKGFSHPNIVPVLGSMVAGERFGVLTAYVESASVAALANYGIPPAVIIHLCYQAAQAISAAERAGFTHLSLRPSRLLVGRSGELHLVGFGEPDWLRKVHACEKGKRSTQWSAPELGNPGIVPDSRADVFSIGQIACQLIQSQAGADSMDDPVLCDLYEADTLDLVRSMASPSPNGRPRPDDIASCLQGIVDPSAAADWPDLALIFEHMDELTPERRAA